MSRASGAGAAESLRGRARPAQLAPCRTPEAALERGLGFGPALPGPRRQCRDPRLGWGAATAAHTPRVGPQQQEQGRNGKIFFCPVAMLYLRFYLRNVKPTKIKLFD